MATLFQPALQIKIILLFFQKFYKISTKISKAAVKYITYNVLSIPAMIKHVYMHLCINTFLSIRQVQCQSDIGVSAWF